MVVGFGRGVVGEAEVAEVDGWGGAVGEVVEEDVSGGDVVVDDHAVVVVMEPFDCIGYAVEHCPDEGFLDGSTCAGIHVNQFSHIVSIAILLDTPVSIESDGWVPVGTIPTPVKHFRNRFVGCWRYL